MSNVILIIGAMIFLAHFLALLFRRTSLPDVLVLMGVGLVSGPLMGWVNPDYFGKAGPVMATVALVVILFEGGTSLQIEVVRRALATTGRLTFGCFLLTGIIVSSVGYLMLDLQPWPAALLGIILAGTSSAVVIPMVNSLKPSEGAGTALVLESALTDVLSIVGVFTLIQVITQGNVSVGPLLGNVLSALLFAIFIGVLGGAGWLMILGRVRDFPNTISSTIAYAFIVYGITDGLGFSGAIAAMALGITLTNFETMGLKRLRWLNHDVEALTAVDRAFYSEAVFLLKTYFFVYLGMSIRFNGTLVLVAALTMTVLVVLMRTGLTRSGCCRSCGPWATRCWPVGVCRHSALC